MPLQCRDLPRAGGFGGAVLPIEYPVIHLIYTRSTDCNGFCPQERVEVLMAKEASTDSNDVRVTSDDGRTSFVYEVDSLAGHAGTEIAEHPSDTAAYDDHRALDDLFWGRRSRHK